MKADIEKLNKARKKAKELLAKMNINEKVGQLSQFGRSIYGGVESYYEDHYKEGKIGSYLGVTGANKTNMVQKNLMSETPHNIPAIFAYDVIHGYKTTFPPLTQSFHGYKCGKRMCVRFCKGSLCCRCQVDFCTHGRHCKGPSLGKNHGRLRRRPLSVFGDGKGCRWKIPGDFIGQRTR